MFQLKPLNKELEMKKTEWNQLVLNSTKKSEVATLKLPKKTPNE